MPTIVVIGASPRESAPRAKKAPATEAEVILLERGPRFRTALGDPYNLQEPRRAIGGPDRH